MPDSTRPTRSTFSKLVRSLISNDTSLSRIASDPGGKNLNIIFAYITSLAYDRVFHSRSQNKNMGIEFINNHKEEWFTIDQFLDELDWGSNNKEYAKIALEILFNSFHQDGVFEIQGESPNLQYKFVQELDYPTGEQLTMARESNKYFMLAIDDLVDELPHTLFHGAQTSSRMRASQLPMWEAILNDPLSNVYRNEMLHLVKEQLEPEEIGYDLTILELGAGTGTASVKLVQMLVDNLYNVEIDYYLVEEIGNQLKRAQNVIQDLDKNLKSTYEAKLLKFNFHYLTQPYSDAIDLRKDSVHLILSFQTLHYLSDDDRQTYFKNLSRMLHPRGFGVVTQWTSHDETFPHPLSLAFLVVEGFQGFPTVQRMNELVEECFKSHKSSGIDTLWVLKGSKL